MSLPGSNLGTWILYTDRSSQGIVLIALTGEIVRQAIKCYPITNNEVKYEAVHIGLELTREMRIEQIEIKIDSQLVVNQMQGNYVARVA